MPKFSKRSLENLATCDHHLQILFNEVIKLFDCTVLCGYRNQKDQTAAYIRGDSKLGWPLSKHNQKPSRAVDVAPFINGKISWKERDCIFFAGKVMGMAAIMNMQGKIRSYADRDGDGDTMDQDPWDLIHFEVID